MKFLITGAYGFVGSNLCRYLTANGHECDALDIPAARRDDVPYVGSHTWEEIAVETTSTAGLDLFSYDCIVHLAGKAHDLKKVASEQSYFDINVGLTQRIFDRMLSEAVVDGGKRPTFVYFSSSKASADGNAYGRSKLEAEKWLLSHSSARVNLCILRPAMIHGPGNKGNLNLLWGVAKSGIPWPLAAFENRRSFTSIGNVCAAVEAIACQGTNGLYTIADDDMVSTNRLVELMAETCGSRAKLLRMPRALVKIVARVGDFTHLPLNSERLEKLTEDSHVDNSQLKQALGWKKMPIDTEMGMRVTLKSFLQQNF